MYTLLYQYVLSLLYVQKETILYTIALHSGLRPCTITIIIVIINTSADI